MKEWLVAATALAFGAATAVQAADPPPPWAYGFTTPVPPGTPPAEPNPQQVLDNVTLHTLPGSKFSFTRSQIANRYGPADWFPEDHPAMPEIVAKGKVFAQPQVYACSLCHYPNGKGRPENANITGLTYEYFMQQMMDFRSGARKTSDPRKANTGLMTRFAQMMTDDEIKVAAQYFTAIPATPWITVVEGATVPKTKPQNGMLSPTDYLELSAVFNGPHPETGEDLVVVDDAPEGVPAHDLPSQPAVFAPDYAPQEIAEIAEKLRLEAGLSKTPTGEVANGKSRTPKPRRATPKKTAAKK